MGAVKHHLDRYYISFEEYEERLWEKEEREWKEEQRARYDATPEDTFDPLAHSNEQEERYLESEGLE